MATGNSCGGADASVPAEIEVALKDLHQENEAPGVLRCNGPEQ